MVKLDNPTEVQDLFLAEPLRYLTPILTPTKIQIVRFTDTMAAALTHCTSPSLDSSVDRPTWY